MTGARLTEVELPDFGMPALMPVIPDVVYQDRMERFRKRAAERGYDRVVVYADREHSANLSYLTGFDPRFEEALLVVGHDDEPAVLVGNECWGMAGSAPLSMRRHLYQDFSLPSQPRDRSLPLGEILGMEGIGAGSRVGVVGWKVFGDSGIIDLPAFIVDDIRRLTGPEGNVENATDILIGAADGLRVINEVEQLAYLEWAACQTSSGVRHVLSGLRPGMTEQEAVRLLEWNGTPLSCHLMLTAGPRASLGLLSPGDRPIERGDRFTVAFGIWGALNCRAGFVAEGPDDLPDGIGDYVDRLVAPYFEAVAEWYGALHVGSEGRVTTGDHRPASRRPLLWHLPQPGSPDPSRRVGQLTHRSRIRHRTGLRDGASGRHHPGHRHRVLHQQHRGRHCPRRRIAAGDRWPINTRTHGDASPPGGIS